MVDAGTARTMWLWRNDDGNSDVGPLGTDSWALTIHGASAYIATRMKAAHDHAWNFAQGRQRRLRDATVSGMYARITGRVPVVRTVCAPFKLLNSTSNGLLFPVLEADKYWRMDSAVGPVKEILQQAFHESRVNATWVKLPAEFGPSTAGLAFITRNDTGTTVGCGCSVDARWAKGHSALHGDSITWQAFVGPPTLPTGVKFADPERMSFFEPLMKDNVGSTITADSEWLRSLSPQFPTTTVLLNTTETKTNFTSFESILLNTRLWDLPWLLSDTSNPIQQMEAVVSAYFVNALSRVGWEPQRDSKSENPNPILTVGSSDNDHLLHDGGEIWARPTNVPTVAVKQEWFNYATAWQLNESALYLSVAILAVHLVIVFCHVLFVIWKKQSSESWNSISELIALAYRSQPEQNTLENCGAGIMLSETLGQEVKVVAVEGDSEDGVQKVQLVPCNSHKAKPSAREIGTAVQADTEYA
ncbi:hypothetical protein N0V94_004293 [Neodidymelliopsis sp. IMI 364377]|nr:hypothetical protein N0V94_004293 [Neodidymelliopsis sp. IMI 364377]